MTEKLDPKDIVTLEELAVASEQTITLQGR